MLCRVVLSYLDIKAVCLPIVRRLPALHYIICLFFVFRTVYYILGYRIITDTWAVQQILLLKRSMGLEILVGCLASSSHCLCAPCVRRFSGPDSHHSPSFSSCPSPSCGTCGGVVRAERQKGHSNSGNWQQQPCHPSLGWPWRNPHGCYCLRHCWACHPGLWQTSWR